ncbi:hypothetical protein [Candidatus Nitronereus thalassa]|uniref:FkbM family methyltransferase n=1 Tax=Candidatus Nitronereus thalassa TaxID=3020898 RepID=A0ABU3K6B9_9BACT|nr:hypothetical protein [Candidatus Nitronereus thalassa]MDT7041969.1 hypothetical protein [Candidatus Nitronereus thalassa]
MNPTLKEIIKKTFPTGSRNLRAYNYLIRDKNSYLHTSGWMDSLHDWAPQDVVGDPVPWMNYPIIKFLKDRLKTDIHLFEYGSGFSTSFYAKLVHSVTSVEYDEAWFKVVEGQLPNNAKLIYRKQDIDGEYCRAISLSNQKYDVIIVDGFDRVNCVKQSVPYLSERGVILLDDSQREEYEEAYAFLKQKGLRFIEFEGLKATGNLLDRSTIFYRDRNCFDI